MMKLTAMTQRPASVHRIAALCALAGAMQFAGSGAAAQAQAQPGPQPEHQTRTEPLQAVNPVELPRYMGIWYEQARLPNRFQKDCAGQVSARYSLRPDGRIDVLNRCAVATGEVKEALGEGRSAAPASQPEAGILEVRFAPSWLSWLPLVWGDYWIIRLDPDYQVALVGTPDRKYLWLLSRAPRLSQARVDEMMEHARLAGFATQDVVKTPAEPGLPRD